MKTHIDLFERHKHLGIFVETGTCYGRSVEAVLKLGFTDVRSVEALPKRYSHCMDLFDGRKEVTLWLGESVDYLEEMITDLTSPALFWLDAHPSGNESYDRPGNDQSTILKTELKIIQGHPVKNHVILIDDLTPDIQEFCTQEFKARDMTIWTITEGPLKVLEIL